MSCGGIDAEVWGCGVCHAQVTALFGSMEPIDIRSSIERVAHCLWRYAIES